MEEKSIRKLKKYNKYSYALTIPKEMVEKYGWREGQKMLVSDKGRGKLEISDWRRR